MGLFGSSSSSNTPQPDAQQFSTRSNRQECWDSRDRYYACLTSKNVIIPPGLDMNDGRGPVGKLSPEEQTRLDSKNKRLQDSLDSDPCLDVRKEYEGYCAKSWIDYFNKRRVLEERQRLMYAQGKAPPGSGPAPGSK